MKITHIYNNNVVLAKTETGEQLVAIGRGLAFGKKMGQNIDEAKIEQRFVAEHSDDAYRAHLLAETPAEMLALASELEKLAVGELGLNVTHSFILPLADHLRFAVERADKGIVMEYPLAIEVSQLYPREIGFGRRAVALVAEKLGVQLPAEEAVPFALHLVNSQFTAEDLGKTYKMTEVFAQIFSVISFAYNSPIDQNQMSVARFVTHLRYLFVRTEQGKEVSLSSSVPAVHEAVRTSYPQAYACAGKVKMLLEMHLGVDLSDDEHTYLTIHIARLAEELLGITEKA
ncbi:MAG: PRD domain-containing protein [Rothia sp. (in: high G+C Gram-positive bacteria)]|nr:PRD domain-containing protein [Rothia sp. (in: high G+C Gram-positive bacteria)]